MAARESIEASEVMEEALEEEKLRRFSAILRELSVLLQQARVEEYRWAQRIAARRSARAGEPSLAQEDELTATLREATTSLRQMLRDPRAPPTSAAPRVRRFDPLSRHDD